MPDGRTLENIVALDKDEFNKKVLDSRLPAIVDFWAEWCSPCKASKPNFEGISEQYKGRVAFFEMDTQKDHKPSETYGVRWIPTFIIFDHGAEKGRVFGFQSKLSLQNFIDNYLSGNKEVSKSEKVANGLANYFSSLLSEIKGDISEIKSDINKMINYMSGRIK